MNTSRLYLRERTQKLIDQLLGMEKEAQMKFLGFDVEERLDLELNAIKRNLKLEPYSRKKWDIMEKGKEEVIGSCGFHNWLPEHERAEIGYFMNTEYRGKGYMREALEKVIQYGLDEMNLNRIEAFISPDNTPSIALAKGLGFQYEGTLCQHYKFQGKIHESAVYSLIKSDLISFHTA